MKNERPRARYDVRLVAEDMGGKGWMLGDLAREASVSKMTITRFFQGQTQTPKTAKKVARALGRPVSRYLIRETDLAAAS